MDIWEQLKRDEGCVLHVYRDSLGILTAGVGHNCEAHNEGLKEGNPITQEQSDLWLLHDVADASRKVDAHLPWAAHLDEARHGVLVNMAFNMGIAGLLGFHRTLAMVEAGNYEGAASAMMESRWAQQTKDRARRLSQQMSIGEWV